MTVKPKILILDIETRPALSYHWRMWKENIAPIQNVESGDIICVGMKWMDDPATKLFSTWEHGHEAMMRAVHAYMTEADAVVTYNGEKFDLPKITTAFIKHGLKLPPPLTSFDLYKTVKAKLGYDFNRLEYVAEQLGVGSKVPHEGFRLWKKVMAGDAKAQARMERYCKGDVRLTERVYKKLRPYIVNHPHLGFVGRTDCGACGSPHTHSRGVRRTKSFLIQRIQCQTCGSWQDGKRTSVKNATND